MRVDNAVVKLIFRVGHWQRAAAARRGDDHERGDVPGWVFVTMMSAGLVAVLWGVAGDALTDLLETALAGVIPGP